MIKILGISGSLRAQSYNTALLKVAKSLAGDGIELEIATLHGIPLYDGDLEQREGVPAAVKALKDRILANDGVLLSTPEYNNGIPGVFKNAIDWMSRTGPGNPSIFTNLPVAVIGASPGGFGTVLSQNAWLPVLKTLGTQHWAGGRLMLSRAHTLIDENGSIADEATRKLMGDFLHGFSEFVRQTKHDH